MTDELGALMRVIHPDAERHTASDWPYDAAQDDPLTALRIPVVTTICPRWHYLISVVITDDPDTLWHGARPTHDEVAVLLDVLEYQRSWYNASYLRHMAKRPFDIDGGFNSLTFIKRGEGNWAYRRRTWERGPAMVPPAYTPGPRYDLPALLDRIYEHNGRWEQWKTARAAR